MRFESLNLVLAMAALSVTAHATPGPADDRVLTANDGTATTKQNTTPAELDSFMDAHPELRVTDVSVETADPLSISAVLINNNNATYKLTGSFVFGGIPLADAESTIRGNGRRATVLRTYVQDGVVKVTGVSVPNTGKNERSWHIHKGTVDAIRTAIDNDGANECDVCKWRPVTIGTFIDPSVNERRFAVIAISNHDSLTQTSDGIQGFIRPGWSRDDVVDLPGFDCGATIIDVAPDHNTAMQQNAIVYTGVPTAHGGCDEHIMHFGPSLSALKTDVGTDRLLFFAHYILHGTGTSDGDTEYIGAAELQIP